MQRAGHDTKSALWSIFSSEIELLLFYEKSQEVRSPISTSFTAEHSGPVRIMKLGWSAVFIQHQLHVSNIAAVDQRGVDCWKSKTSYSSLCSACSTVV